MTYRHKALSDKFHLPVRFTKNYVEDTYEYYINGNKVFTITNKSKNRCDLIVEEYLRQVRDYGLKDEEIYNDLVDALEAFNKASEPIALLEEISEGI